MNNNFHSGRLLSRTLSASTCKIEAVNHDHLKFMNKPQKLDLAVKQYIIDCVDAESYGLYASTVEEKIQFLKAVTEREYPYDPERSSRVQALTGWYQGAPTACNISVKTSEIIELGVRWGHLDEDASETKRRHFADNWFNLLACKTGQLFNGRGVKHLTA